MGHGLAQELAREHGVGRRGRGVLALRLARAVVERVADVPHARQRAERVDVDAPAGGVGEGADEHQKEGERRGAVVAAGAARWAERGVWG